MEELRLRDDRQDGAGDEIPARVQMERNDGLDVQHVLSFVEWPDVEIGIVLERHADQVGDRILRLLGQVFIALLSLDWSGEDRSDQQQAGGSCLLHGVWWHGSLFLLSVKSRIQP